MPVFPHIARKARNIEAQARKKLWRDTLRGLAGTFGPAPGATGVPSTRMWASSCLCFKVLRPINMGAIRTVPIAPNYRLLNFGLLRNLKCILNLDSEVSNGALQLAVA